MGAVTKFKTPSGDEMVIMPATDYARLLDAAETASDVAAFDDVQRRLAKGEEELLPAGFVARIVSGEHPIMVWREYRGLSRESFASGIGLSLARLTEIETGKATAPVDTLEKIAAALAIDVDDLS